MNDTTNQFHGLESGDGRAVIGRRILWNEETTSTHVDALTAPEARAAAGILVHAAVQPPARHARRLVARPASAPEGRPTSWGSARLLPSPMAAYAATGLPPAYLAGPENYIDIDEEDDL